MEVRGMPPQLLLTIMTIKCPQCGNTLNGVPKCERDDHGKLYQVYDFTCPCGYGWVYNPAL